MTIRSQYPDGQFCWVDLTAQDLTAAAEFYGQLFGWQSQEVAGQDGVRTAQFRLQGHLVAGVRQPPDSSETMETPAVWNSYVQVADIQQLVEQASQHGGKSVVPVTTVRDAGWMAMIQDPAGACLGVWQPNQHFGAELVQDLHAFCWNELGTRDTHAVQQFYRQLFGWEFLQHTLPGTEYYVIENQGEQNGGMMLLDAAWGDMPSRWFVYFAVENADFHADQVRQLGGSVLVPPHDIPEGRLALVTDQQGAMFHLVQMDEEDQVSDAQPA